MKKGTTDAEGARKEDTKTAAARGPLSLLEARDVVSYWSLLELFEPADWSVRRGEFVDFERWRVPSMPNEATAFATPSNTAETDGVRRAAVAGAEHSGDAIGHLLTLAFETKEITFNRPMLRPQPGSAIERPLPFFTVYLGILPKARLYAHMLRLLDAAESGLGTSALNAPDLGFDAVGEDPSLRGETYLAAFHISPWGKIVSESFSVSGYVGALNLALRRMRLIEKLRRSGEAGRKEAAALRSTPVFDVATALKRCEKLSKAFETRVSSLFHTIACGTSHIAEHVFDKKAFTLTLRDPQPLAQRVAQPFLEHAARGVAGYIGYTGPIDAALRVVFHRPDHTFSVDDIVRLGSFYLGDLARISVALEESGTSPCGAPLAERLARAAQTAGEAADRAATTSPAGAPGAPGTEVETLSGAVGDALEFDRPPAHKDEGDKCASPGNPARIPKLSAPLSRLLLHGIDGGIARADLLEKPAALAELLDPVRLPSGRWPSPVSHHLYVAQQAAVNAILALGEVSPEDMPGASEEKLESFGPIASVNGPPGTGKSWLLRDVIAEVVVRKARRIAALSASKEIFDFDHPLEFELGADRQFAVMPVKRSVARDSLVVVASNNNAAIRNITDELPSSFALERAFLSDAGQSAAAAPGTSGSAGKARFAYWQSCARAMKRAGLPKRRLSETGSLFGESPDALLENVWGLISVTLGRKSNRLRFVRTVLKGREPGVYSDKKRESELALEIASAKAALEKRGKGPEAAWLEAKKRFEDLDRAVAARRAAIAAQAALDNGRPAVYATPLAAAPVQHKTSLWVDEDFEALRSSLFLAALALSKATVVAQSSYFLSNFKAIAEYIESGMPPLTKGRPQAIWDVIALLVPVISTTLASAASMFAVCGPGTIGWLLLDEASQAMPQAAAGILNRARRAVILGDPRQLMPVVTMPERLCEYLRRRLPSVDARWSPHVSSLQSLADNTMPVGAAIRDTVTGEAVWTGLPLRTHRRCASPMFDVANALAYANQMVQMTPRVDAAKALPSLWLDVNVAPRDAAARKAAFLVRGVRVERHMPDAKIVPEEMAVLRSTLVSLLKRPAMAGGSIFVVSPFRSIADMAARVIDDVRRTQIAPAAMRADTVHAFQGQEADAVIFVLGTEKGARGRRQRHWAANPTNLLNVGVTRARRAIVVIGCVEDWRAEPAFAILAERLRIRGAVLGESDRIFAAQR